MFIEKKFKNIRISIREEDVTLFENFSPLFEELNSILSSPKDISRSMVKYALKNYIDSTMRVSRWGESNGRRLLKKLIRCYKCKFDSLENMRSSELFLFNGRDYSGRQPYSQCMSQLRDFQGDPIPEISPVDPVCGGMAPRGLFWQDVLNNEMNGYQEIAFRFLEDGRD